MTEQSTDPTTTADGWFKTTHWSVVREACGRNAVQAPPALAGSARFTGVPLYCYNPQVGRGPEDAQD